MEDCIFKNDSLWFWNFGNLEVKVLNVKKLPKKRNLSVQFWGINDASVILSDTNSSDIDIVVNTVDKFNLVSNNNLEELDLSYVGEISLKNFNSRIISSSFCVPKKLCATNCLIKNLDNIYFCNIEEVMLDNSFIMFEDDIALLGLKQLNLINSGISSNGLIYMDKLEELVVKDDKLDSFSYLEVGKDLFISGEKYNNINLNKPLRIAASDLVKGLNNGIKPHKRCLSRDEKNKRL